MVPQPASSSGVAPCVMVDIYATAFAGAEIARRVPPLLLLLSVVVLRVITRRIRFSGDLFWIRFSVTTHTHLLFFIYVHVWRQTHFRLQSANDVVIGRWYYTIYIRVYRFCRNECNFCGLGKKHICWCSYVVAVLCTAQGEYRDMHFTSNTFGTKSIDGEYAPNIIILYLSRAIYFLCG